jgi:hypothetical protein
LGLFGPSTRERNSGGRVFHQAKCKCGEWVGDRSCDTERKAIKDMEAHKKSCTTAGVKEGKLCPACHMPKRRCKGKFAKCVNFDKDELRSSSTVHHGNRVPKGLKSASGAKIKPGQNINGAVYDNDGKRVWDIKKRMGQE